MKRVLKTICTVACLTALSSNLAIANPDHSDRSSCHSHTRASHDGKSGQHMERSLFLHGIALTAEQEDQVFKLTHAEIPKMRDHMKQEQQLKQELSALTQASSFDENKAKQIADKLANLTRERAFSRAKLDSQVFALLTPAQREQATKNKEKMTKDRDGIQPTRFHHRHSHQLHPTNS